MPTTVVAWNVAIHPSFPITTLTRRKFWKPHFHDGWNRAAIQKQRRLTHPKGVAIQVWITPCQTHLRYGLAPTGEVGRSNRPPPIPHTPTPTPNFHCFPSVRSWGFKFKFNSNLIFFMNYVWMKTWLGYMRHEVVIFYVFRSHVFFSIIS